LIVSLASGSRIRDAVGLGRADRFSRERGGDAAGLASSTSHATTVSRPSHLGSIYFEIDTGNGSGRIVVNAQEYSFISPWLQSIVWNLK
jgi:hypothetical protein